LPRRLWTGGPLPVLGNGTRAGMPSGTVAVGPPGREGGRRPRSEEHMADKSPGRSLKKSGKSIKEKRAERKAKRDGATDMERLTSRKS
jgi:hypothetical protein